MSESLKIVTYNLRCCWDSDGINSFVHRAGLIWEKLCAESPDVIAFQEVIPKSLEVLKRLLPEYTFFGQGRNAYVGGEGLYTAVKTATVTVVGFETFWIGPQPYVPESRFEDQSECPRICVSAMLRHNKTDRLFRVYNIHLDHVGKIAREKGIQCVLERISCDRDKNNVPVVLLGDFNSKPDSRTVSLCSSDKNIKLYDVTKEIICTYHEFGSCNDKIDYIYVSENWRSNVAEAVAWEDVLNGIYLSDHYPVCAKLVFENE